MSTPASFNKSIGYFDPPEARNVRYRANGFGRPAQDLLGEGRRGRERRRVLEDVKRAVEVIDVRPLVGYVVVDDGDFLIVSVVLPRDLEIELRQRVAGERLAFCAISWMRSSNSANWVWPEHRALDAFEVVAEQASRAFGS
jgi:hypothetical protein